MPVVTIAARVPGRPAGEVFDTVADLARYPELVDTVRAVDVEPAAPDGSVPSRWEVLFRNGVLRWREADWFDRDRLTIRFAQTDGDFDVFDGEWRLRQHGDDVLVTFRAEFDFGVATLAPIIDPVAVRVLTETTWLILRGLFPGVVGHPAASGRPM